MNSVVPHVYAQIYVHLVFVVKFRQALISKAWKDELYMYITGIIQNKRHKVLAINGVEDHIHIFIGLAPVGSISELVKVVKVESSNWINSKRLTSTKFSWQIGYGAFTYARRDLNMMIRYIANQEVHHAKKNFKDEFVGILRKRGIKYKDEHLFRPPSDR